MMILFFLFLGYLLGAIPFGLILTRFARLGDIRKIGSGNIGATNVLRTGHKTLALATLLLDGGKGAIAVLIVEMISQGNVILMAAAGSAALIGHCFPVWISFKGGKGVATYIGTIFALFPPAGFLACFIWGVTAIFTHISSLAALVAATITPIGFFLWGEAELAVAASLMSVIIFIRHRENIKRLRNKTEPMIGEI